MTSAEIRQFRLIPVPLDFRKVRAISRLREFELKLSVLLILPEQAHAPLSFSAARFSRER